MKDAWGNTAGLCLPNHWLDAPLALNARWMVRRDLDMVLWIERQAFGEDCWDESQFLSSLRQRATCAIVVDRQLEGTPDLVVGFLVFRMGSEGIAIINMATHPGFLRQGVGAVLLAKLFQEEAVRRRGKVGVHVPERNLPAQLFFRKQGFRWVCTVEGGCCRDDSYFMERVI